ncbi:FusB/FusC family EF-G-binding protein [Paenibacillus sp. GCM10023248]|uniref:FusB/FusC family EF-G-binding protein n=1 Tax=unclassified Paenibacillus TaxID=185978 RepID=UPI002379D93C|nr:FusB/FusC family EF-G-binding protein [Paenibacillus sp. MAHUQ-63]MDD9265790.1 FusB/FusC family EF-G-binding protein [Paenibacillus sp. MAHUQ-63]
MNQPFIRNHQYNEVKKQIRLLQQATETISDPKVVESVRYNTQLKISETFPNASEHHARMLNECSTLRSAEQFQHYLKALEPYLEPFPQVTAKQLNKLFPKVKKLKAPDFTETDFRYVSYLGWLDIATNTMFLVYQLHGELVGITGRYTPANKGVCFICNKHEEVALFSAATKWKPANASSDYYKAIGNYMCVNSEVCNKNMTDLTALERFVQEVAGPRKA